MKVENSSIELVEMKKMEQNDEASGKKGDEVDRAVIPSVETEANKSVEVIIPVTEEKRKDEATTSMTEES
jgi:hypothetical protein